MAAQNFTGDGQQRTLVDLLCSPDLSAGLHGHLKFLSILNSFLSITAFLGNALILIALRKESTLHPPSKLLPRSLATTDLCVGLISEPVTVIFWMSVTNEQWNICALAFVARFITCYIFSGVSVGTLTAINVDRLLALLLGLRYTQTSCNFKANLCDRFQPMAFLRWPFSNVLLESLNNLLVCQHNYITVSYNLYFLLHKDFPHPPSSKSSTTPC